MKKFILVITAVAAISSSALCQLNKAVNGKQNPINSLTYLQKARKQKTVAWICLGTGAALVTTGVVIGATKVTGDVVSLAFGSEPEHNYTGETILVVAGGAAMLTSIPLFIGASNNRQKAKLMITEQKTAIGLPVAVPKNIPSLTLSISI